MLLGAPRRRRVLTISGKEFLPSKGAFKPIVPESIELDVQLRRWGITRKALVDLAILVGTDFNDGVKGIGPKKALKLVQDHGRIEDMPPDIRTALAGLDLDEVRGIFLSPAVSDDYTLDFGEPDRDGIMAFLVGDRQFSRERVEAALERAFPQRSLF